MAADRGAVVTGGGSGLGRCIARALLRAGWQVAVAGRREDALRETVHDLTATQMPFVGRG